MDTAADNSQMYSTSVVIKRWQYILIMILTASFRVGDQNHQFNQVDALLIWIEMSAID